MKPSICLLWLMLPGAAFAQDAPLCADRPGLGTPPCVVGAGRVVGELGVTSWTLDREGRERTDTIAIGNALARIGIGERIEAQVGWTAFGMQRTRDPLGVDRSSGTGDVSLALRRALSSEGIETAAMARVTLPTGGTAIGGGDWSLDLLVPVSAPLGGDWSFDLSPTISAAVDEDGSGRHLAYGGVAGVTVPLGETLGSEVEVEVAAMRDGDPDQPGTPVQIGLSMNWQPQAALQLDAGCNLGLNDDADDVQLYVGIARRF